MSIREYHLGLYTMQDLSHISNKLPTVNKGWSDVDPYIESSLKRFSLLEISTKYQYLTRLQF